MGELVIGKSIAENYSLWRYMSLDKLIDILASRSLYFTPLRSYNETDPFEGYMPIVGLKKLAEMGQTITDNLTELNNPVNHMQEMRLKIFEKISKAMMVNCWHANNYESEAMWKLYSDGGKGIAITTNIELLKKAINPIDDDIRVSVGKVRYIDFFNEDLDVSEYLVDGNIMPLTKRLSYKHENEVRMYITPKFDANDCELRIKPYSLPINPLVLVDKVYISPYAKEPYISSTIAVCKIFGLSEDKIKYSELLNSDNYLREGFGLPI